MASETYLVIHEEDRPRLFTEIMKSIFGGQREEARGTGSLFADKHAIPVPFLSFTESLERLSFMEEQLKRCMQESGRKAYETQDTLAAKEQILLACTIYAHMTFWSLVKAEETVVRSMKDVSVGNGVPWEGSTGFPSHPSMIADVQSYNEGTHKDLHIYPFIHKVVRSFTDWVEVLRENIECACASTKNKDGTVTVHIIMRNALSVADTNDGKGLELRQYIGVRSDDKNHLQKHYEFSKADEALVKEDWFAHTGIDTIRNFFFLRSIFSLKEDSPVCDVQDYISASNFIFPRFVERLYKDLR